VILRGFSKKMRRNRPPQGRKAKAVYHMGHKQDKEHKDFFRALLPAVALRRDVMLRPAQRTTIMQGSKQNPLVSFVSLCPLWLRFSAFPLFRFPSTQRRCR
jgi:hypothetical protein